MSFQIGNKLGKINKGKKRSLESKKKMSEAAKKPERIINCLKNLGIYAIKRTIPKIKKGRPK